LCGALPDISRNGPRKSVFAVAIHLGMSSKPVNAFCHTRSCQRGQCLAGALVNPSQAQEMRAGDEHDLALGTIANLTHSWIMRAEASFSKRLLGPLVEELVELGTDHGLSSLQPPAR
jgi:hypothetical protein